MIITKQGQVLIQPNFEGKLSCKFDMSRLQVAFMLRNLSVLDKKQYALQVEFGLAYNPLTDVVMLLLHGNKFYIILKLMETTNVKRILKHFA